MFKVNFKSKTFLYFVAILFGIIAGFSSFIPLQNLGLLTSEIFIKIFKCISLPIIALSIIVTLSQYTNDVQMTAIWKRTLFYTLTTTIIAATIACILYLIISPANITNLPIHSSQVQIKHEGLDISGLGSYLSIIILANFIQAFVVLPIFLTFHGIKQFQSFKAMFPALNVWSDSCVAKMIDQFAEQSQRSTIMSIDIKKIN